LATRSSATISLSRRGRIFHLNQSQLYCFALQLPPRPREAKVRQRKQSNESTYNSNPFRRDFSVLLSCLFAVSWLRNRDSGRLRRQAVPQPGANRLADAVSEYIRPLTACYAHVDLFSLI
jgi:hypothetical protein